MRVPGWEDRLRRVIIVDQHKPFAWGRHDCILFAARCIEAVTGEDPAAEHRGTYDSAIGAMRLLKALGFATPADAIGSRFEEVHPITCRSGDIVSYPMPEAGNVLGVVFGEQVVAPNTNALATGPLFAATRGFRIV